MRWCSRRVLSVLLAALLVAGTAPFSPGAWGGMAGGRIEAAHAAELPADGTVDFMQVVPATHGEVLGSPRGVSFNGMTGRLLVSDPLRKEVLVYDDTFSLVATLSAGPDGAFENPADISDMAMLDSARKAVYKIDGSLNVSSLASDTLWGDPQGIHSSGIGLWVVDRQYGLVYVYRTDTGEKLRTLSAGGSMDWPTDVFVDGSPFVTDKNNQRVLELDGITGAILNAWDTSTLGPGNWWPTSLTADGVSRLWVLNDVGTQIHRIDHSVAPTSPTAYVDTIGSQGVGLEQMRSASGIAASTLGILVADTANGRVKVLDADSGGTVMTFGGGAGDGDGEFWMPGDVEIDAAGNVYVADFMNDRVQKLDADGTHLATYGPFDQPAGIGVAPDGTLWVAEQAGDKVWRVTAGGAVTAFGGTGSGLGQFEAPEDVAVAPDGTVVVADTGNARMQRLSAAGSALEQWATTGSPDSIDTLPDGQIVYTDRYSNAIRRIRPSDHVVVGSFTWAGVSRIDVDDAGNVYAACADGTIRMFDCYGTELLSWGGPGFGTGDFQSPAGVGVGASGDVWVADSQLHRLQRFLVHDHTPPVSSTTATSAWSPDDVQVEIAATDSPGRIARFTTSLDGTATEVTFPDRVVGWRTSRMVTQEGTTTVGFLAEDAFGNVEATKTAVVRIDRTDPTLGIFGVPSGWASDDVTLTLDAYDAHSGVKDYLIGGATLVGDKAVVAGEGTTTVSARARDNVGRLSAIATATVSIDRNAPSPYVQLLAAPDSNPLPVRVDATDAISGVDEVYYQVDGGTPQLGPATLNLAFSGEHTITVWASDKAGNASSHQDYAMTVGPGGGEPPLGDFAIDGGRQWTNKYEAPVSCDIEGAAEMRFRVAGGVWSGWTAYSKDATVTLPIDEGACTVEAEFKNGGGQTVSRSDDIGIDRMPGTCGSNIDRVTYRGPEVFVITADDGRSGPGDRFTRLDGAAAVMGDELAVSEPGSHTIEFWAEDLAGNESSHTVREVRFTHPVTLEVTATPSPVSSGQPVQITITMTDEDSAPVAGKPIIVNYSYDGGANWYDVPGTFAADNGDGTYSISHSPSANALYCARFYEDEWYNGADSLEVPVALTPRDPSTTSASASATLVNYGGTVAVYGVPKTQGGAVIGGATVTLWTKPYGSGTWTQKAAAIWDGANQRYAASTALTIGTYVQMRFAGDATNAPSASSGTLFVRSRAKVGNPVAPTSVYRGRKFTTYGSLNPSHATGTAVRIYRYRYVSGSWKPYGTYVGAKTVAANKYSVSMSLPYAGRWRLRSYHADGGHYGTYSSGYDYVTVK